jgi:periplasmic divalent cation tolerance protein
VDLEHRPAKLRSSVDGRGNDDESCLHQNTISIAAKTALATGGALRQALQMTDYISVYMTVASAEEAETIARALVTGKLAACVNILPGAKSIYRWKGQIEEAKETILVAKSRATLFPRIEEKVKNLSSYECPCIVAMPIAMGHRPYLDWLTAETVQASAKTG